MATLSEAYRDIAERHVRAAQTVLAEGLHEVAIFHCYHAFESIACAAIALRSSAIPARHRAKIQRFVLLYRPYRFGLGAATLAALVEPLREQAIYPIRDTVIAAPREAFTPGNARDLIRRVDGMVRTIVAALRM